MVEAIGKVHQRLKVEGRAYPEVDIREIFLEVLQDLWKTARIPRRPDRELCELVALEYECRINPTWPMPEVVETLRSLKERKLALGIVSNAQFFTPLLFPALLEDPLETLGFDPELCVWSYIYLEAKPSEKSLPDRCCTWATTGSMISGRQIEQDSRPHCSQATAVRSVPGKKIPAARERRKMFC